MQARTLRRPGRASASSAACEGEIASCFGVPRALPVQALRYLHTYRSPVYFFLTASQVACLVGLPLWTQNVHAYISDQWCTAEATLRLIGQCHGSGCFKDSSSAFLLRQQAGKEALLLVMPASIPCPLGQMLLLCSYCLCHAGFPRRLCHLWVQGRRLWQRWLRSQNCQ